MRVFKAKVFIVRNDDGSLHGADNPQDIPLIYQSKQRARLAICNGHLASDPVECVLTLEVPPPIASVGDQT
jgi:hypothetical protein